VDILELFPIDFDLTPLARLRLREAAGGELAVVSWESLSMERRRAFSQALGEALVDERSAMRLGDALPGLSILAIPLVEQWDLRDRLRGVLGLHGASTAADVACLSLDEIGLWRDVGRTFQRETAAAAVDALGRGALEHGSEVARDALRLCLNERARERMTTRAPEAT
jgi:hypothetical protein